MNNECPFNRCGDDLQKAYDKISRDCKCQPICCIGPTGATGPTGPTATY